MVPLIIQFASLERVRSDPEFQKEYLEMVGEEPIPVMPDEMENLVQRTSAILNSSHYLKISTRQVLYRLVNGRAG